MIFKENYPISLEQYFSYYNLPLDDIKSILRFLMGDYEAIKDRPQLAHIIFNVLDPYIFILMAQEVIRRNRQQFDFAENQTQLVIRDSEGLLLHSYDLIARRTDFGIVENALVMGEIFNPKLKFLHEYGNLEILSGVVILLFEYGYFKKKDHLGRNVNLTMAMRSFEKWYDAPFLQPVWRNRAKCIEVAKQKIPIIMELEDNKLKFQLTLKH